MRVAFLGTSRFARPALAAVADRHEISLVVTQPDRPVGRHGRLRPPPIKEEAARLELPLFQPERINTNDAIERLRGAEPEVIVVVAYGQILKREVFTAAPLGAINIHASLLPAYRGAAPIHWAIIRGETVTGVTTILIDAGMDTGDVLVTRSTDIGSDETAGDLEERLAHLGADAILETLEQLRDGTLEAHPQAKDGVSLAPLMTRDDGRIDWTLPAKRVHDLVRGTSPWPGAWTLLQGERVKVHRTARTDIDCGPIRPGEIGLRGTDRLLVGTADRLLEIREVQREGRPRIDGAAFLHGLRGPARFG